MVVPLNKDQFPRLIKSLRSSLSLTQTQLGEALGVEQATVSRWENGGEPTIDNYHTIISFALEQHSSGLLLIAEELENSLHSIKNSRGNLVDETSKIADLAERYLDNLKASYSIEGVIREDGMVYFNPSPAERDIRFEFATSLHHKLRAIYSTANGGALPRDRHWIYMVDAEAIPSTSLSSGLFVLARTTDRRYMIGRLSSDPEAKSYIVSNDSAERAYRVRDAYRIRTVIPGL